MPVLWEYRSHDKVEIFPVLQVFPAPDLYVPYLFVTTLEVCCTPCEGGDTPGS